MKKMICIVLSIAMMISCVIMPVGAFAKSKAQIYKDGKHAVAYEVQKDNTIKILSYRYQTENDAGKIVAKFPTRINGKTVTVLGKSALNASKSEKYFGKIKDGATYSIVGIKLPSELKIIEDFACASKYALRKITIPDSVEYIGECAFAQCENLKVIHIGKDVKFIGAGAFSGIPFDSLTIEDKKNGGIYLENYLLDFPMEVKKYKVMEGTTLIADMSHDDCLHMVNDLTLPKSIKYIADNAFSNRGSYDKFIIRGYRGTAAEIFAKKKGATFKALNPAAPKIAVKSGTKKLKVSWKSVKTAEGYQIKYGSKRVETKKLKKTIKLKKGTYKVKVRCYKIKDGKRIYSPWSKTQKIKVK